MLLQLALLSVLALHVIADTNIALNKPVAMSSFYHAYGAADHATDGNTNGDYNGGQTCTHTQLEQGPWIRVDLETTASVSVVRIAGRADCCTERFTDFTIYVGDDASAYSGNTVLASQVEPMGAGEIKKFFAVSPISGRYVWIRLDKTDMLTVCEIEVYESVTNVALQKSVTQSSEYNADGTASHATDGNISGMWLDRSCTHTNTEPNAWLRVDMGAATDVAAVRLYNREDCCGERLHDFKIHVGDNTDVSQNSVCAGQVGALSSGDVMTYQCAKSLSGRYVGVRLSSTDYLTVCELQVFTP